MCTMLGSTRTIHDLDDGTILHVLSFLHPLPDWFNIAASCRRLRNLALDRRTWLVVSHTMAEPIVGIPRQFRQMFPILQDAIQASRPGDTIVLLPGEPHQVSDVVVPWPLHIMGGGTAPEQTVLQSRKGADTVLDFRASGRLFNLSLRSQLGSCVVHRCGKLSIEQVSLSCDAEGLDHLVSPIATLAASPRPTPPSRTSAARRPQAAPQGALGKLGPDGVGPGLLSVVESRIKCGGMAIRLQGTGTLRSVRVINTLFWFDVDSSFPGMPHQAMQQPAAGGNGMLQPPGVVGCSKRKLEQVEEAMAGVDAGCSEAPSEAKRQRGGVCADVSVAPGAAGPAGVSAGSSHRLTPPTPSLPAWMQRPPFDPVAFQQRVHAEMRQQQAQQAPLGLLEKKSEQWSRHHAAAVGASPSPQ